MLQTGLAALALIASIGLPRLIPVWPVGWQGLKARLARQHPTSLAASGGVALLLVPGIIWPKLFPFCVLGAILTLYDLRQWLLPDVFVALLAVFGWLQSPDRGLSMIAALAAGGVFLVVRLVFRAATGRDGMGLGDVKLAAALGVWIGLADWPMVVIGAAAAGLLAGLMRARAVIPFGPFLIVSAGIVLILRQI